MHKLTDNELNLIRLAVDEDVGRGDITSEATIPGKLRGCGIIRAKESLVLAGLPYAKAVFHAVDPKIDFVELKKDGDRLEGGEAAARILGKMRSLLIGERLALNLLQRLCGVATMTARFVEQCEGYHARVCDTRKTTPLWRRAEKYAVTLGGGVNHRMGLYDVVLIKDNHIDANQSIAETVAKARFAQGDKAPVIVEIRKVEEIEPAIEAGATRLLLDNMSVESLKECVGIIGGRAESEASGSVSLQTVREIAATGVDYISVGALTHSVAAADLNFKISAGDPASSNSA